MTSTVETADKICGATKPDPYSHNATVKGEGLVCGLPENHDGEHRDRLTGRTW